MSELLVQIQDSVIAQRGDVIVTSDIWGEFELTKSNWRILICPDVSDLEASAFTSPQLSTSLDSEPTPTAYRGFYLDLDAMSTAIDGFGDWLADDTRAAPKFQIAGTLDAYKLRHDPISNPAIIGQSRKIIG